MKKYYMVFKNQVHRKLEHKFDFFLKRLQSIVAFLILYFVWVSAASTKSFSGYSKLELVTYVLGATILGALIFGVHTKDVTYEINTGNISAILVKPVSYFWYVFARESAERSISFVLSIIEAFILWLFLRYALLIQTDLKIVLLFLVSLILASAIYHMISYAVSLTSFWTREAYGPKWLFEWVAILASGQYFPLSILSPILHLTLLALPLSYIVYFPMIVYLGKLSYFMVGLGILVQLIWLTLAVVLVQYTWKKGLKVYAGEGI